ncbi:MAG: hypothetical protein HY042_08625, partial [Spirochaetia bacterium]|nr:hypothetical protein [Spirochaetia bacterium]
MFTRRNRIPYFLAAAIVISGVFSVLTSQPQGQNIQDGGQKPGEKKADAPAKDAQKGPRLQMAVQDYSPISITDTRFVVRNLNFDRRYAGNGLGEFLDVVFDIANLTSDPVDMYAYVLAYYETDAVDRAGRRLIPYPSWRINDPERNDFVVHFITTTPNDIADSDIWGEKDREYQRSEYIQKHLQASLGANEPLGKLRPPFWKVLNYVEHTPTKGLKFTLFGEKGPAPNEITQTNYEPPNAEEKKNRMHKTLEKHKYTLEHNRRLTTFRSHHFSPFRSRYVFFNSAAVLLFDAGKAQKYEEAMKPLFDRRAKL